MTTHFLDLSACQPDARIDWNAVALATIGGEYIAGIIVKATDGNGGTDLDFAKHVRGICSTDALRITHGLKPFLVAAYHFAGPSRVDHDAEDEASHFVAVAGTELDFYMLDLEVVRQIDNGPQFVMWALTFCDAVEAGTNRRPVLYTGGPFFNEHAAGAINGVEDRLRRLPLCLAAYVADPTRYIPKPWDRWDMHQRSGDIAPYGEKALHVPGIDGGCVNVDHDVMHPAVGDVYAWVESLKNPPPTYREPGLQLGNDGPAHDPYWVDRFALDSDPDDPSEAVTAPGTPTSKSQDRMQAVKEP